MRNSKRKKVLLGLVLGLLVFSFIPGTLANGVIKRSLDDAWLYQLDGKTPLNDYIGAWSPSEQLIIFPHFNADGNFVSILDCDYHGHVHEREMPDGRHMITVQIHVKEAPVTVEKFDPANPIVYFDGYLDYLFILKFIVDLTEWPQWIVKAGFDDDGFDDDTGYVGLPAYLPLAFDSLMMYEFGLEFVSVIFIGTAKGVMVNGLNGLEYGDAAKLKVATIGFVDRGYNFINPFMPIWPLDYLKLF
jgi:hypothetical protein